VCETWSVTLKEGHSFRVLAYRVSRRKFEPKREEIAGGWRRQHNEKLRNLCASPTFIRTIGSRRTRLAGHVAFVGEMRNAYKILVGKTERKRPLVRLGIDGRIILKWTLGM
jgi:hypothetical protein